MRRVKYMKIKKIDRYFKYQKVFFMMNIKDILAILKLIYLVVM